MAEIKYISKKTDSKEKTYTIVIKYPNGDRDYREAEEIKIVNGCLITVDPKSYIPCEVHCYSLAQIRSFIFDYKAVENGKVEIHY